jgi:Ca-activated chloride channel homolog
MQQSRVSRAPLVITVAVGVLLIVLVRLLVSGGFDLSSIPGLAAAPGPSGAALSTKGSTPCVELNVAASSEKAAVMSQVVADFVKQANPVSGRCVSVAVRSVASGAAANQLAQGWNEAADGPKPDVWTPASTAWLAILQQRLTEHDQANIVPTDVPHVVQTPLVIAMPRPMAEAIGWPDKPVGWSDILALANDPTGWGKFGHPEWGPFRLGKTNPDFSTSGLHATIGTYFAATGLSSDLTTALIAQSSVQAFVKGVEKSVVHYGDTTLTFLSNLQKADDAGEGLSYVSAVTVEEKSVWDYDKGNPTGDPTTLGQHAPPRTPLVAIYPKEGTLISDSPWVVLTASWVDDAKRQLAADLLAFLQAPAQQERFQSFAFRDYQGHPGSLIGPSNGMLPSEPKAVLAAPAPDVVNAIERSWSELRKRAEVLLVIDVSGSMGSPVAGSTKLELAKSAAAKALDQFAPDDNVGLWIFSSNGLPGVSTPYLQLFPAQPLGPHLAAMKTAIDGLQVVSGTALYTTTRAATAAIRQSFDPTRINAVVLLTDGRNEYQPDDDLPGLLQQLKADATEKPVRVFTIGYGADADMDTLRKISEATRAAAYDAADPSTIEEVFTSVVSNF